MSFEVEITVALTPIEIEVGVEVTPYEVTVTVDPASFAQFYADQAEASALAAAQSALDAQVAKIEWQGDWVAGAYEANDAVAHLGSSWIANKDTSEEPSLSADDWDLMAKRGDDGTGSGGTTSYIKQPFNAQTNINVIHNFGTEPLVQVYDVTSSVIIPLSIVHNSANDFTVTFTNNTTGTIVATYGVLI